MLVITWARSSPWKVNTSRVPVRLSQATPMGLRGPMATIR